MCTNKSHKMPILCSHAVCTAGGGGHVPEGIGGNGYVRGPVPSRFRQLTEGASLLPPTPASHPGR